MLSPAVGIMSGEGVGRSEYSSSSVRYSPRSRRSSVMTLSLEKRTPNSFEAKSIRSPVAVASSPARVALQGLRIKIGRMGKLENPALESDFDQYPEKPGDFLNIVTKC